MPSSSNPKPHAAASKPRSPSRSDERTLDMTPRHKATPKAGDAGVKRRAQKKKQAHRNNLLALCVFVVVTSVVVGAAQKVWPEYQEAAAHVAQKKLDLATLKSELDAGKRRLDALASASGKRRVLVENGFIKSGERLLLFPKTPPNQTSSE